METQVTESNLSNRWKYIGFNDIWMVVIGIPFIGLMLTILFSAQPGDSWTLFVNMWGGSIPYTAMYWLIIRQVMICLRRKYYRFGDTRKRLLILVVGILLLAPLAGSFLRNIIELFTDATEYEILNQRGSRMKVLPTYVACFFMVAVYEAIYFYHQLKKSIEERERVKQEQIKSELAGLRNQVNPHFLFNSMNTLMNIVMEDQHLAVRFLRKLSTVYRYILENREEQIIPLRKELEFIQSYVFLQKERFKGNLEVHFDIEENKMELNIVPLSLQILFENAIKHNIISRKKPLRIEAFIRNNKLVIRNNLQRKEQVMDSTKVGLENIKNRYKYFTQERIDIKEDDQYFSVGIPLLVD